MENDRSSRFSLFFQRVLLEDKRHRLYLIERGRRYVLGPVGDFHPEIDLSKSLSEQEDGLSREATGDAIMDQDQRMSGRMSDAVRMSDDTRFVLLRDTRLSDVARMTSGVADDRRMTEEIIGLRSDWSSSAGSSTTFGEELDILGEITNNQLRNVGRQMSLPKPIYEELCSAIPAGWDSEVTMSSRGQLVVDPTSGDLFFVRELYYKADDDDEEGGLRDLSYLGLVTAPEELLPLTHPYSGRKFDIQTIGGNRLAKYDDPALCLAAVKKAFLKTNVEIKPSRQYLWRRSEVSKSTTALWTSPYGWLRVRADQPVAIDYQTKQAFVLSSNPILGCWRNVGVVVGTMEDPVSGMQYTRLSNGFAYEVESRRFWNWQPAELQAARQLDERGGSKDQPLVVNTEDYLKGRRRPLETTEETDEVERESKLEESVDSTITALHQSFTNVSTVNREREMLIRSAGSFHIVPETLLVIERVSSRTCIANLVICSTPKRIYTQTDIDNAREFASERRPSIRLNEDDVDMQDAPYLLSVCPPSSSGVSGYSSTIRRSRVTKSFGSKSSVCSSQRVSAWA